MDENQLNEINLGDLWDKLFHKKLQNKGNVPTLTPASLDPMTPPSLPSRKPIEPAKTLTVPKHKKRTAPKQLSLFHQPKIKQQSFITRKDNNRNDTTINEPFGIKEPQSPSEPKKYNIEDKTDVAKFFNDNFTANDRNEVIYIGPDLHGEDIDMGLVPLGLKKNKVLSPPYNDPEMLRNVSSYVIFNWNKMVTRMKRKSKAQKRASNNEIALNEVVSIIEEIVQEEMEDMPDGYSNEFQRAFAHSQSTAKIHNDTQKARELAKQGKYVVLTCDTAHCKSTDAALGMHKTIHSVHNTRAEAWKAADKLQGTADDYEIIGPENLEQTPPAQNSGEDVPFQEGVGAGNPINDPKHVKGERWRIKYASDNDLKKHGDSEMSPVNEESIKSSELKHMIQETIDEVWGEINKSQRPQFEKIDPKSSRRNINTISKPVKDTNTGEWVVKWMINGKRNEDRTYYTNDEKDAWDTYQLMTQQAQKKNVLEGIVKKKDYRKQDDHHPN